MSGHSAGGLATYLHTDYVHTLLPPTVKTYAAVPDAGFFLDHANLQGVKSYGDNMRSLWALANATGSLNAKCLAERSGAALDCIFPQNFAQFLQTPLHVTQSQYDQFQINNILDVGCDPMHKDKAKKPCSPTQMAAFLEYRTATMAALNASGLYVLRPGHGMFNDACIVHTQGYYGDWYDNAKWEVPYVRKQSVLACDSWLKSDGMLVVAGQGAV